MYEKNKSRLLEDTFKAGMTSSKSVVSWNEKFFFNLPDIYIFSVDQLQQEMLHV